MFGTVVASNSKGKVKQFLAPRNWFHAEYKAQIKVVFERYILQWACQGLREGTGCEFGILYEQG